MLQQKKVPPHNNFINTSLYTHSHQKARKNVHKNQNHKASSGRDKKYANKKKYELKQNRNKRKVKIQHFSTGNNFPGIILSIHSIRFIQILKKKLS